MDYEVLMNGNVKIGQKAPDFDALTTCGNISLNDYKGKWLVLFSHPGDFTPVCTTEIIAFTRAHTYFKQINTELLGLSIDSNASHLAWIYDIYCRTGIQISFRTILIYPMTIGRFIPEILRIVQALQISDCTQGSTAANWIPNQPVIVPPPKTFCELQERQQQIEKNKNGINWYLSFKEPSQKCINNGISPCDE